MFLLVVIVAVAGPGAACAFCMGRYVSGAIIVSTAMLRTSMLIVLLIRLFILCEHLYSGLGLHLTVPRLRCCIGGV